MSSYNCALTRDLSPNFYGCLHSKEFSEPIDLPKAILQHEKYVNTIKSIVSTVHSLPADDTHPDCCFIEDTCIIINHIVVISRMGAAERRGEELEVKTFLQNQSFFPQLKIHTMEAPATMDGGDVLYTGTELLVGLSSRTNEAAITQLRLVFKEVGIAVEGIPVTAGLHLKSVVSAFDEKRLIIADTIAGRAVMESIERSLPHRYQFITVPDEVAANVLRLSNTLIVQAGYPESEMILRKVCEENCLTVVTLDMSELVKADGALTCCSVLFNNT